MDGKPKILILGFGRLGRAFYDRYQSRYEIRGIKRTPEPGDPPTVTAAAIQNGDLGSPLNWAEVVVFSPSSGGGDLEAYKETYLENLKFVLQKVNEHRPAVKKIILIGSTGVYPRKQEGPWTEDAPIPIESPRQEILLATEKVLIESGVDFVILRCGGIYGEGRGNFKRILEAGEIRSSEMTDQFYPLINQEDICGVMDRVIETGQAGIFNLVDDSGLKRRELFAWLSREAGIPIVQDGDPPVIPERNIPNTRLKDLLGYLFRSPRVTAFLKDLLGKD